MARKFLYVMAGIIVLGAGVLFALRIWGSDLARVAFIPTDGFQAQAPLARTAYTDPTMWLARPGIRRDTDPARWLPAGVPQEEDLPFAVFFVHPTSFLERTSWNAALDDAQSQTRARTFVRGLASPFNRAAELWAPKYRQATFGAFLTDAPDGQRAIDAAYADVAQAFAVFLAEADPNRPIVLAGHSQGALHLLRLLREEVAGTPAADRIAAVYAIGWPISVAHDLPALPLPACAGPGDAGCIVSWSSFAEPADPGDLLRTYAASPGYDGEPRGDSPILCSNPLTGQVGGEAPATANLGTLVPEESLADGALVAGAVPARCDASGILLIGDPPELGPYVLPGNNYHVYDIPLFWRNLREDVVRRVSAWQTR
ncbi:DUF3089 domain-containing protein [Croceibacterium sp. TMG7-5b_MA50]|uniref:DUF3089 domain-containing protein n=1 Tax=Croceibacterium sp. TMG7-5b_MA50 TaxID=3121290 RepID=UPI00322209EE